LRQAIQRALEEGDLLPDQQCKICSTALPSSMDAKMKELIDQLMDRLMEEGYVTGQPQVTAPPDKTPRGTSGPGARPRSEARFEITDKTIDFLGFKTLKDLMGRSARAASAATTRAIFPPASNRAASRAPTNSATR
jgi:Ca-activated chloride channel family protein